MEQKKFCKFLDGEKCLKAMFRYSMVRDSNQLIEKMQEFIPYADITLLDETPKAYEIRFDFVGIAEKSIDVRFHLEDRITETNGREFKRHLIKDIEMIN